MPAQPIPHACCHALLAVLALLLSACSTQRHAQTSGDLLALSAAQIEAPITTPAARARERENAAALIDRVDRAGPAQVDLATTLQALQAVAFHDMHAEAGVRILVRTLQAQPLATLDAKGQRELLTQAHQLVPAVAAPWIAPQLGQLATPREFAIAAHLLLTADAQYRPAVQAQLAARTDGDDPRLIALAERLQPLPAAPPLEELLGAPFKPGLPVVFSLQRQDRRHIGLLLLRGADGRFVRGPDGLPLHRPHLALALSQLPGTITNGNTPQGLFTIVGTGVAATNPWIGPTPFLHSKLPIEASPAEFAHDPGLAAPWTEEHYLSGLPPSWRSHRPMREAWLAGRAGRDELLLHGTTIDASSYQQRPWYPGTPSAGCLVALERWDASGRLQHSDQLTLLQAFARESQPDLPPRGHLVVVNLDTQNAAVSLAELLPALRRAEASMTNRAPP